MIVIGRPRGGGNVLVLGGGGARGFAHLGVLKVLEESGIQIDRIVGVSIGALAGALYCRHPSIVEVTDRVRSYVTSDRFRKYHQRMNRASKQALVPDGEAPRTNGTWLSRFREYFSAQMAFHRVVLKQSILSHRPMTDCMDALLENGLIEDLAIPLTIVAADLRKGNRVQIESGDLYSAILGSTSLPGIFPPVEREGALLSDYGVLCSIPVSTALGYRPDRMIVVDLTPELEIRDEFSSGLEIIQRMEDMGCFLFKEHIASIADVTIKPDVCGVDWADFDDMDRLVELGTVAAEAVLPALLRDAQGVVRTHR